MDEVTVEVLDIYEHFKAEFDNSINGLYRIKLNDNESTVFRNGDSWGILSHYLGEPVTKCMGYMRDDRIEVVESAINKYLESNK
ncbi:MAG TPA: hypothetical protein GX707_08050 [Epulopiscium sp.]|nr:hypothetical protein [Candidatus Epulonipiscium sp.]